MTVNWDKPGLNRLKIEQRLKEMANMGVGNKPLMDIGGSNTITDRSVPIQTGKLNLTLLRNRQNTHPNQIPNIAEHRRKNRCAQNRRL